MVPPRLKVSGESVNYRIADGDKHCGNCGMFHGFGIGICDLVKGIILSPDVCDKWIKRGGDNK